ncbi:hypothetical protein COL60_19405 [Bacillus pseudomycoides]|uniref:hypothetical protein n=1 Tax=Bacillus pseudomycoides TaxID=64104 RepID=UPI000BF76C03|nr:hypothetical protein [Bacillus pseudomycoides]PFZ07186.1 hypothetical protein COL60_19405 [Bacillus pseudomycoides]
MKRRDSLKGNIGFLTFNRSKGKIYVYLTKALRDNGKKKNITLYKFGRLDNALERMYAWRDDFENKFPAELLNLGYDWNDLHDWILSLETGYSKKGRKLIVTEINV